MRCSTVGPPVPTRSWPVPGPDPVVADLHADEFHPTGRTHPTTPTPTPTPPTFLAREFGSPPPPTRPDGQAVSSPLAEAKPPPGPREREALDKEKAQQDRLLAEEIYARMRAQRELSQARMAALLADVQTEIQRLWQEVMINRRKVHDEILKAWHKVLIG